MFLCQQFAGFNQIVDALSLVCDLDRTEKNQLPFLRQPAFSAGFLLIVRLEQIRVDGVGILITVCPVSNPLTLAFSASQRLQPTNVMDA